MTHQFQIGDLAKIRRTGLDVEVVELHPRHSTHVLCGWFDDSETYMEAYFATTELDLIKMIEKAPASA